MNIKYIYIYKYKDKDMNLDLNFGSKYLYYFEDNCINYKMNSSYVENFYSEYNCINNLTAIIGKNRSGKTTVMRAINDIFSDNFQEIEYIILLNKDNKDYLYYSFRDGRKIVFKNCKNASLSEINCTNIGRKKLQDFFRNKVNVIYYSGIFDKASPLTRNDYLIDISTNKLLRDRECISYSSDSLDTKEEYEDSILKADYIDKFELEEIERKVKFYIRSKSKGFLKKYNLFDFPRRLSVVFNMNEDFMLQFKDLQEDDDTVIMKKIDAIFNIYIEIVNNRENDGILLDNKEQIKIEFLLLSIIEILLRCIEYYGMDLTINLEDVYQELADKELEDYDLVKLSTDILYKICNNENILEESTSNVKEDKHYTYVMQKIYEAIDEIDKLDILDLSEDVLECCIGELDEEFMNKLNITFEQIRNILEYSQESFTKEFELFRKRGEFRVDDFNIALDEILGCREKMEKIIIKLETIMQDEYDYFTEDILEDFFSCKKTIEINLITIAEFFKEASIYGTYKETKVKNKVMLNDDEEEFIATSKILINSFLSFIDANEVEYDDKYDGFNITADWSNELATTFIKNYHDSKLNGYKLNFTHEELSSGHKAYLDMFSRLADISDKFERDNSDLIILLDEGEINLHPEIQIKFLYSLLELFRVFYSGNHIHLFLTSNSPFIISDIPNTNIIYLGSQDIKMFDSSKLKTLGANINSLLINSFFMSNGTIGQVAMEKMDAILSRIKKLQEENKKMDRKEFEFTKGVINLIGEPLIRFKLDKMLDNLQNNGNTLEDKIKYYEDELNKLKEKGANLIL